jgi:hypothetical protein
VIFNFSVLSPDFNEVSQQECATFTQDNKVIAVLAQGYETPLAADCFAKAKIPSFWVDSVVLYKPSCATAARENFYGAASVFACRYASFIKLWNNAGLFPPKAKVGILQFESVDGQKQNEAVVNQWDTQLKKLGFTYETFSISRALNSTGYGQVSAQMNAAILKFKSDGVNVVLFTPPGSTLVTTFLPAALAQGYIPNYGFTTNEIPQSTAVIAPAAVGKAAVISWRSTDLTVAAQEALPPNPAIESCKAWSAVATAKTGAETGASDVCDFYNILAAAFKGATKLDAATLKKRIAALGTSFDSSVTYGGATKFDKKLLGGATKARVLTWDAPTKSFVAKSKAVTIP